MHKENRYIQGHCLDKETSCIPLCTHFPTDNDLSVYVYLHALILVLSK